MSSFTSDEEAGDEHLEIKPPQAHQLSSSSRDRRRDRDRYSKSSKSKDYRRSTDEDRNRSRRRDFEQSSSAPVARNGGVQRIERNPRLSQHERDRSYSRDAGASSSSSSSSRPNRKHSDKYLNEPSKSSSGERRDDRHREFQEQKQKRKQIEEEGDRLIREIERKRERERREEMRRYERAEKRKYTKSHSSTPPEHESDHEEQDVRLEQQKSVDRSKPEGKSSNFSLFPEVEDIEESSSGLEDGEQVSPHQSNSDVSDSEHEIDKLDNRSNKPQHNEGNPHSDVSDRRSSSRSASDSPTGSKASSRSKSTGSDSDREDSINEKRNGASDNGERPSKIFKGDSPVSPDSDREISSRKGGSDVEILEGNGHIKTTHGNSESAEVEEATDVLNLLPPYFPAIQGCRRVEEFRLLNRIEEGTYGVVYRAEDRRTNEVVALKRLKMEKEKDGFPITSLREINTLLKAQHENIVTVREIVVGSNTDKIFLVMDYVEHDLKALMETLKQKEQAFIMGEVKCLMIQLLRAVAHLHDNWILHRDLKTSNLLLSHKGILKVGDFGLAREYGSPLKQYTPIVVTLWYRSPELLLGLKDYSCPIDVWSVGCIFGELLKMEPMFPGKSEANQLNLIFQTLGTPNDKIWPGYSKLPLLQKMTFADYPVNKLKSRFHMLNETGIDLMNKFLTFNPAKRITAEDALRHKFFEEPPLPIDPSVFPTWPAKSEMGHRKAPASPKPPSGGRQFKDLREDDGEGFFVATEGRRPQMGPGFSLKF